MDSSAVCFSGSALTLLGVIAVAAQGAIITLFWMVIRSKDAQIEREKDQVADLWEILRPSLGIARGALNKVEQGAGGRTRR